MALAPDNEPFPGTHTVVLTHFDNTCAHMPMTIGYIIENPSLDLGASLCTAAHRVAEKWRLLAGRVEMNTKSKRYQIRIPDVNQSFHPPVHFTTTFHNTSLDIPDVYRASVNNQAMVLNAPPIHYFRDPSVPQTLAEHAAKNAPILSIHLSMLKNCICVGVTVPHGVFDGVGFGLVLKALDCEIKGLDWNPPSLNASKVLEEMCSAAKCDDVDEIPSGISMFRSVLKRWPGVQTILLAFNSIHQYLWCSPTPLHRFYLGPDVVSAIVKSVQDNSSTSVTVTASDILWAWLLKAAHKRKTGHVDYIAYTVMSFRRTLAPLNSEFESYPHNLLLPSVFRLPSASVTASSLQELAVLHRRSVEENRTLAYFRAYNKWIAPKPRSSSIFRTLLNLISDILAYTNIVTQPLWFYSNTSVTGLGQLVLSPAQLPMIFSYGAMSRPTQPLQVNIVHSLPNGGIMFKVIMDADMWEGVEEELAALRNRKGPDASLP